MATKGARNAGVMLIVAGIGIVAFAIISSLTTADRDPDWVGIISGGPGLIMVVMGMIAAFRSGSAHIA